MYVTSSNKNNQGGFTAETTMSLNEKLNSVQSRSTSRPPVVNRMNSKTADNEDELVSSRFSELPRGKL